MQRIFPPTFPAIAIAFIYMIFAVPSAPQAIKAIPASSTKIIVSWLPPDLPNGDIVSSHAHN